MSLFNARAFALLLGLAFAADCSRAEAPADPGKALYQARCASCHDNPGPTKAPTFRSLKQMTVARVFFAMSNGAMKTQAAGLSFPEMGMLATYASLGQQADYKPSQQSMCARRDVDVTRPVVASWAFDAAGTRALGAAQTIVGAKNAPSLELAWTFGLPGTVDTRSQPVATAETLFVGAAGGHVFALDRKTGCAKWHTATPLRTSLTLGHVPRDGGKTPALFFGDQQGFVTALDAGDGRILWRERVGLFDVSMLSGAIAQTESTLIVPISSIE